MATNRLPLFIFDLTRRHKLGECDFVACTDADNGFVAKIDYVRGKKEGASLSVRIGRCNNGISLRLEILRFTGRNLEPTQIRALLEQAEKKYVRMVQHKMSTDNPSIGDCIAFLEALIRGNRHFIDEGDDDLEGRETAIRSLGMLEHCLDYLKDFDSGHQEPEGH